MPHQSYDAILAAPFCHLGACFSGTVLTRLDFLPEATQATAMHDKRVQRLANELATYWRNPAHRFELPFEPAGTPFQLRVWRALMEIEPGKPTTYGALASHLGTAARAVGQACGANPLPIVIPCHRVVSAQGLGGFMHAASGAPLDFKNWLLQHERQDQKRPLPPPQPSPAGERGSECHAQTDQ
jgi:methylated-DNA-[protein]-cysteine S-methyltransferase